MAARKFTVTWSPHDENRFLKCSNEISLFKVHKAQEYSGGKQPLAKYQDIKLSEDLVASALHVNGDISCPKALAWCPKKDSENVVAVGRSNGHIILINMLPDSPHSSTMLVGKEFVPKLDRSCNALAWNPIDTNLLAAGLDKVRNDSSLLVWDVESRKVPFGGGPYDTQGAYGVPTFTRPSFETGTSEVTFSIDWLRSQPKSFITGQGQRYLRIFDMRERSTPQHVSVTKAMLGVCVDPFSEFRAASFSEGSSGIVCIWDIRSFQKPVHTMQSQKSVASIAWCPTRSDLLTVLPVDSSILKLYDLQHLFSAPSNTYIPGPEDESDSVVMERTVQFRKQQISSFSWHPSKKNTILMSSIFGGLQHSTVFERIALSWSPNLGLAWGCGSDILSCSTNEIEGCDDKDVAYEDISWLMKKRAVAKYGDPAIMQDQEKLKMVLNDPDLSHLWLWMQQTKSIQQQESRKVKTFYGIKSILSGDVNITANDSSGQFEERVRDNYLVTAAFQGEKRKLSLRLCGWDPKGLASNDELLNKLIEEGEIERAASLALFNNNIHMAINILSGGNLFPQSTVLDGTQHQIFDPVLNAVAMALSGFSPNESMWRSMCASLSNQLKSPYLRAAFAFLTSKENDFHGVLKETEVALQDRVGFACKYLSDKELMSYVERLTRDLVQSGSLEGLLLTGLSSDGLDLLENYVTKTSDIQTATLLIVYARAPDVRRDPRVLCWLDCYRDLLDTWRLWHQRAMLDSLIHGPEGSQKIPKEVLVSCNFCGKSVSPSFFTGGGFRSSRIGGAASSKPKSMACPNCKKPLPRCAICMINMATSSLKTQRTVGNRNDSKVQSNPFDNWFTWCQSCRHGGHAVHMMDWFDRQTQCPVTGCECHCDLQDGVSRLAVEKDTSLPETMAQLTVTTA